ncbi:hypothetical protein CPC735_030080 [Coccidioides posadasii C735 delta SOWgp]|uniref:CID domain-containing protein n=2 Tax=Coccidioides posadasii TaxID=199306 RepID=C5P4N2_COCP7|nr:hypothetical protein CPC735_030080 [Coccidioides posadasii C735 delta SOWgp]EER27672.1 hypothetical protein CPC735_030080 [Coccidioides posadasii C735 delta SOWgp]|eukprot:XP_003069817.1 hypothetical protein CPC735_030080 [Coccidioides posadasii C735 delta SOWgp]
MILQKDGDNAKYQANMTSHQVAIAKASFSAGLLRPDPTSVPRDEITEFHNALDTALSRCSPANIQACKAWILKNITESANRVGVLGKYLTALATFFPSTRDLQTQPSSNEAQKASPKRKRLHILYLLNDLLHHTKYHSGHTSPFATLTGSLQPYLVDLFALAAAFDRQRNPNHFRRLAELLDIWEYDGYYSKDYINKLRETVANPEFQDAQGLESTAQGMRAQAGKKIHPKDVPYVMPATHGDPMASYHELPAGNLLPHIIPNSSIPIKTQSVKALQFVAGPADESLIRAVKSLLKDVDQIYGTSNVDVDDTAEIDIDELGQITAYDEVTGESLDGDAYYGWSRSFCQKMKQKRGAKDESRSPSRSRSRSYSPPKRRRHSDSRSAGDQRRSWSRDSLDSGGYRNRGRSSRSLSRSQSPPRRRRRSHSRSRSYSPPPAPQRPSSPPSQRKSALAGVPPPPPPSIQAPFNSPHHYHPSPQQSGSPQPSMFVPPPRPPNYHGPWPPPPPPPPIPNQHGFPGSSASPQAMNMNVNIPGYGQPPFMPPMPGTPFVPPPPPPGHAQQGQAPHPGQDQHGMFQYPPTHPGHSTSQNYRRDGGPGGGWRGGGWSRGGWS